MTTTLNSTFLKEATYNASTRMLTVIFTNGRTYSYKNVDQSIYQGLISADSAGRFFNKNIVGKFTTGS